MNTSCINHGKISRITNLRYLGMYNRQNILINVKRANIIQLIIKEDASTI